MKKFTAVFVAALMLFCMIPLSAFAESGPSEERYFDDDYYAYVSLYNYRENVRLGVFSNNEAHNDLIEGAAYDRETNTLTLTYFNHPELNLGTNMMGDDFALKVVGECALGGIFVFGDRWGGSLRFTGTGTLTVNESKEGETALNLYAEYSDSTLHFDKDVTVKLYGSEKIGGIFATNESDPLKAIVLDNGQAMDVKSERNIYEENDSLRTIRHDDYGVDFLKGYQVKLDSDPDGLYIASYDKDTKRYLPEKCYYIERYDYYLSDYSDKFRPMTEEELAAAGFSFVMAPDKVSIEFLDTYSYEHRGNKGFQVVKNDDPDGVYVLKVNTGIIDFDYLDYYPVAKLRWDSAQGIYVLDDIPSMNLSRDEFNASFTFMEDEKTRRAEFRSWFDPDLPPTEEDGNFYNPCPLLRRASDPDGIYIQTGTFGHDDGNGGYVADGYTIKQPVYNEEYGVYYEYGKDEDYSDRFCISYADFEDSEFSFVEETYTERRVINYIDSNYELSDDALSGVKVIKESEPDSVFAAIGWSGDGHTDKGYSIRKLNWNAELNFFFEDEESENILLTFDEFEASDFSFAIEDQPLKCYYHGGISNYDMNVCVDADGNRHLVDYSDVYDYNEEDFIVAGDMTIYPVTKNETLTKDDVTEVTHTVVTDAYHYTINGTEFIYSGGNTPDPEFLLGDVNGDKNVDVNDATLVQMIAAELIIPTNVQKKAADVNRDGNVDIADATLIQQFAAEIISHF